MILEGIRDRALVAVVSGEMPDEIEIVGQGFKNLLVSNRLADQLHPFVRSDVFSLCRQEVVDDDYLTDLLRQQPAHEVGADEAGPAHDQNPCAAQPRVGHNGLAQSLPPSDLRWV